MPLYLISVVLNTIISVIFITGRLLSIHFDTPISIAFIAAFGIQFIFNPFVWLLGIIGSFIANTWYTGILWALSLFWLFSFVTNFANIYNRCYIDYHKSKNRRESAITMKITHINQNKNDTVQEKPTTVSPESKEKAIDNIGKRLAKLAYLFNKHTELQNIGITESAEYYLLVAEMVLFRLTCIEHAISSKVEKNKYPALIRYSAREYFYYGPDGVEETYSEEAKEDFERRKRLYISYLEDEKAEKAYFNIAHMMLKFCCPSLIKGIHPLNTSQFDKIRENLQLMLCNEMVEVRAQVEVIVLDV